MCFSPDYRFMIDVLENRRPARLPLYEHIICPSIMEKILDIRFADLHNGNEDDLREFFRHYCNFFKEMTYDTVSFEVCITDILPGHGAIMGGKPGPIQNRNDFEKYPWDDLPIMFWDKAKMQFDALAECMPEGMKAVGGVGNGVFEISEDLVGYEHLGYMQIDDPELFSDIYQKIGDLMFEIWQKLLDRYSHSYAICRFGDDLGFKSGLLISPAVIRNHILPQYQRIISLIQKSNKPFLWHSCGCIFDIMEDVIELGINAKHSNEDAIAPFDTWIEKYSSRIGLLGGFDVDLLCQGRPEVIKEKVLEDGRRFRDSANGFALGSGNSIPDYVPVDGYLAMIEAGKKIRADDQAKCS